MSLESTIRSVMTEKTELHEDEWQRLDVMQSKMRKMLDAYRQDKLPKNKIREFEMLQKEVKKLMNKLYQIEEVEKEEVEMEDLDNLIEEALNEEDDFKPHMMYDPKTGKAYKAEKPEDHERMAKMGYTHEKPELDEMREPYAVVDTADGDKVVGTASDEKGAKSIITTSQLPPMRIKDKKTLKIVKVKKKQMIGQPIKEEKVSMTPFGVSKSLVDAVSAVIAGKKPVAERKDIPEEILDDDVADFIGAASKAAQAGKKTFKFGDKEYPGTIKKDTAKKVAAKMDEEKPAKKEEKEDEKNGKKEPVEIDPSIKEETK